MSAKITLDRFKIVEQATREALGQTVDALAFATQEQAIENIREVDAIDTGSLRNSIYVETTKNNGRAEALAAAIAAGQTIGAKSGQPGDVHAAIPNDDLPPLHARVAACVEHGIYVEMGVDGSATGDHDPRPFLTPAAATVGEKAEATAARYIAAAIEGAG